MNPSDEQLMTAYADGDMQAFELLYARHRGRILGYLYNKLRDRDGAEEVFQATFAKLHAARDRYREDIPFLPWIFTIARNALIDHLRRNQVYRKNLVFNDESIMNAAAVESSDAPVGNTLAGLATLSHRQREVLELRFDQDFSFDEIAARLQTSSGNARQMVSRAIRHLRKALGARK
ncbi:RNA polymerase sigma-70 factor, ECF subfamily [Geoalkalibacter ferrihydriticus]|uniref:RNA polymerase sigma-70 factor, ECF subfamily n=1 Tax=Geoalkalibacter ferrihydriticus TaxID=392333 RepID=A0A1G9RCN1_9BACT|nr:sigma-70 family RNA polymerase sigma factor [Geoalkalibacter ferrihydriticus]SDM20983.1 RNA polymerase sigma-70 factor, ECF subfamily [Geoalkalibacter ferrihydriticus]